MPSVIGSHMVLQRDRPVPIWGTANPGEEVTVQFGGATRQARADEKGKWRVTLPPMRANDKGQTLTITGKNKIELEDILVGEVWIGSGQSNMEWSLRRPGESKDVVAGINHPTLRLFHVPHVKATHPAEDVTAGWEVCSPRTAGRFSSLLYHFGLRVREELDVPVGLIHSSWGATSIDEWVVDKGGGEIYNAMIAPLTPFAVRGVVWYQGECDVSKGGTYRDKMQAIIKGWRGKFGEDLSFHFVQIAPWVGYGEHSLPELWDAQMQALKFPGTAMVVTTDIVDNIHDVHSTNKKVVGKRLALCALAKDYGRMDLVYSGPLFKSAQVEANKVRINFAHVGGGLKSRDGKPLSEFEIAGADGKFVPAEATIDGNTVVVEAKEVTTPTQVRFGWHNTANPNLMNKEGLPASPFQSKNWQGGTGE